MHASWAIAQARSLDRPWHDGASWAGGHSGDRSAIANVVMLKQPVLDMDQVICEVDDLFPRGVPFLLVSAWPTSDLSRYRLALVGHPPLMLRPPSTARDWPSTSLDVRWVSNSDALADAERVLVDGYPMPELQPFTAGRLYTTALLATSTRIVVAYDDGVPLATAAAHSAHGVTLVEYVAVMPEAREGCRRRCHSGRDDRVRSNRRCSSPATMDNLCTSGSATSDSNDGPSGCATPD